ncbi:hypothetical protein COV82_01055 [Candidatus Peregrinibacteria bacterium CG11_big_fil_rev_8_21_14_0_20_46_8]|nr:MAG: hypothetical protein COV82_01055 [Candidatus Peregrinibacteria bacterium CG11_big_fil_rev_8_21_14_0_20_46_8]
MFFQKPADDTVQTIRKKYSLPDKFILTVGGLQPRKNIGQLIDATEFLKIPLVIVGGTGWKSEKNQAKVAAAQRVQHLTDCSAEELAALYHMATLFVFPTLYEGFGIPILEAMAAGCPVICSNTSSMPEVAGDAAILINPQHTTELRDAIQRVWNSPDMRQQLRQKGFAQAQDFSWKKCAQKTLGAFNLI